MSDIPQDRELRLRHAEIKAARVRAKEAARAADAFTTGKTRDKLAEAKAEVERLEAKAEAQAAARQLMHRRTSR